MHWIKLPSGLWINLAHACYLCRRETGGVVTGSIGLPYGATKRDDARILLSPEDFAAVEKALEAIRTE